MDVIVFHAGGRDEGAWASQWVAARPGRSRMPMPATPTIPEAIAVLGRAGRAARGGNVLLLVGHGGARDPGTGLVDLAPNERFQIQTNTVFYNVSSNGPYGATLSQRRADENRIARGAEPGDDPSYVATIPGLQAAARERLAFRARYDEAGRALAGIRRVVFLTCSVGRATTFLDQIARDWQVEVQAFRRLVLTQPIGSRRRLFLFNDPDGIGTNTTAAETEIPTVDDYVAHP